MLQSECILRVFGGPAAPAPTEGPGMDGQSCHPESPPTPGNVSPMDIVGQWGTSCPHAHLREHPASLTGCPIWHHAWLAAPVSQNPLLRGLSSIFGWPWVPDASLALGCGEKCCVHLPCL